MASLLTRVIRRQALNIVPRRQESVLLQAGPPVNKVTQTEKMIALGMFLVVPMLYPIYIMANLQKYNGSNRTSSKTKKPKTDKK